MNNSEQWLCRYGNIIVNYMIKNNMTMEELANKFGVDIESFIYMMRGNIAFDEELLDTIIFADS